MHGEKASADVYAADDWIESRFPEIKDMWAPRDIFNADETGVFYRGLPDRGFISDDKKEKEEPKKEHTVEECMKSLTVVQECMQSKGIDSITFAVLTNLENDCIAECVQKSKKQFRITNYFQ